jgi:hypothetical protein
MTRSVHVTIDLVSPVDDRSSDPIRLAPRVRSLDGLRIGLLDNRKGNADVLLERLAEALAQDGAVIGMRLEKVIFSRPATSEQLDQLADGADVVLEAIGD